MSVITDNPFRLARHSHGLTLDQLAFQSGVNRTVVLRNEQGMFSAPNLRLMNHFFPLDERSEVIETYREFQREQRKLNFGRLEPRSSFRTVQPPVGKHPFTWWRNVATEADVSVNAVCRWFCLHQGTVSKFETQPWAVSETPIQLIEALAESGYSANQLAGLQAAYKSYRVASRSKVVTFGDR